MKTKEKFDTSGSLLSGILLIAGTSIGAGMLALPVVTGVSGFYPALFVSTLCWLFMLATGLLFLEATLWMPAGSNLLSMAGRFLGPWGKWISGAAFLFLYYCLMVSYLAGGVPIFIDAFTISGIPIANPYAFWIFTLLFASLTFIGHKVVDRINWILMAGLIISYVLLISIGSTEIKPQLLEHRTWGIAWFAAPTLFSAYGYHNIIPTLTTYLNRDVKKLRWAIIIGTSIPFIVYSLWQWLIIGTIPLDQLQLAQAQGTPITETLQEIVHHSWIGTLGLFFGLFALITSLLGVALSMVDFLGDGTNLPRTGRSRAILTALVFLPPAAFALNYPQIFLTAISLAGGFGEAILNGLIPIAFVYIGHHLLKFPTTPYSPTNKFFLVILLLFTNLIIALEIIQLLYH